MRAYVRTYLVVDPGASGKARELGPHAVGGAPPGFSRSRKDPVEPGALQRRVNGPNGPRVDRLVGPDDGPVDVAGDGDNGQFRQLVSHALGDPLRWRRFVRLLLDFRHGLADQVLQAFRGWRGPGVARTGVQFSYGFEDQVVQAVGQRARWFRDGFGPGRFLLDLGHGVSDQVLQAPAGGRRRSLRVVARTPARVSHGLEDELVQAARQRIRGFLGLLEIGLGIARWVRGRRGHCGLELPVHA